jgi:hypothetical protein
MAKKRVFQLFFILSVLQLSCVLSIVKFSGKIANHDSNGIAGEKYNTVVSPKAAGNPDFIQVPKFSANIFHPGASPGAGGVTAFSFSMNQSVNYTLDISTYFEPIVRPGVFFAKAAYYMPNGTWLVVAIENDINHQPMYMWLGIGTTGTNLQWQNLGRVNNTYDNIAIAAHDTKIRIIYAESDNGTSSFIQWMKYYSSNNWGKNWIKGDVPFSFGFPAWFIGLSMAANATTFECMWSYVNDWEGNYRYDNARIWESRDTGSGWTAAQLLPALASIGACSPQVFYNQSAGGDLYVCVNKYISTNLFQSIVHDLPGGADTPSGGARNWTIADNVSEPPLIYSGYPQIYEYPIIYCAFDSARNVFYAINNTEHAPDGIRNATWGLDFGAYDSCYLIREWRQATNKVNLFASNGPKLFSWLIKSVYSFFSTIGGILDSDAPFAFEHASGTLKAGELMNYIFTGIDKSGHSRNAMAFMFNLTIFWANNTMNASEYLPLSTDPAPIGMNGIAGCNIFSPASSPGVLDALATTVNASKYGTASLTVASLAHTISGVANITNGMGAYYNPGICGDGHNLHLFFIQESNQIYFLMFAQSHDGGITWTTPRSLSTLGTWVKFAILSATCSGQAVYCKIFRDIPGFGLDFLSLDGGTTFITVPQTRAFLQTSDLACWCVASSDSLNLQLNRSTDFGLTWSHFANISQNGDLYTKLGGAAYDPVAHQYSFLLLNGTGSTNDSADEMKFVALNRTGGVIYSANSLGQGGSFTSRAFDAQGSTQLGWLQAADGTPEWILFSSVYHQDTDRNYLENLSYRIKIGNGNFSSWANYTSITGAPIPVSTGSGEIIHPWDVVCPVNGTPCVAALVPNPNLVLSSSGTGYVQLQVYYGTAYVYSTSAVVPSGNDVVLSFNGASSLGGILPDGEYSWAVEFTDNTGQTVSDTGHVTIDNKLPKLVSTLPLTSPVHPVPRYPTTITITARDLHLDTGTLSYRDSDNNTWIAVTMNKSLVNATDAIYTGVIPSSIASTIYWRVNITDTAGNSLIIEDNGQPYSYHAPRLRLQEAQNPPDTLDLNIAETYAVQVIVPEDAEFIARVFINYTTDNGITWQTANMTPISASVYTFTFDEFPASIAALNYTFIAVDLFGNQVQFGDYRYITVFPVVKLPPTLQITMPIISAIAGLVFAFFYFRNKRKSIRNIQARFLETMRSLTDAEALAKLERDAGKKGHAKATGTPKAIIDRGTAFFKFGIVGTLAALSASVIFTFIVPTGGVALLVSFSAIVLATDAWYELGMSEISRILYSDAKPRYNLAILTIVLTTVSMLAFMAAGPLVEWFKYYLMNDMYTIADIQIPNLYLSLASTLLSSVILLTITHYRDLNSARKLAIVEQRVSNSPKLLWEHREENVKDFTKNWVNSSISFLIYVGMAVISTTNLGRYASIGLLALLPFIIVMALFFLVDSFKSARVPSVQEALEGWLIEPTKTCPECSTVNLFNNNFCVNCKHHFAAGTVIVEDTVTCTECEHTSPAGSKYCRLCGTELPEKDEEESKGSKVKTALGKMKDFVGQAKDFLG